MDPRRSIARKRARWQQDARLEWSQPTRIARGGRPAPTGPVEVLGTRADERGSLIGPYDYRYPIDAGYTTDRTVIRP